MLVGTNLGEASDTVGVTFTPSLTAVPLSRDASQIRVVVPQGAKTGEVFVTVTKKMPDGTSITRTSNALPIMVIWKFFDPAPLYPSGARDKGNRLLPGKGETIQLLVQATYWGDLYMSQVLWNLRHDGGVEPVADFSGWSQSVGDVAQNPRDGQLVGIISFCEQIYERCIKNLVTGQVLYSPRASGWPQEWYPWAVAFDAEGNLHVAASHVFSPLGPFWVWRFAPGQPIVFDPNAPNCLTRGGITPGGSQSWLPGQMRIGGDGTVWVMLDNLSNPWDSIPVFAYRIPASGGSYEMRTLPEFSSKQTGGTSWHLAADCRGEGYAVGECSWVSPCPTTPLVYRLRDMTTIATLPPGMTAITGFTTDGFGNLYVQANGPTCRQPRIWRIMPDQLPSDFYCPLTPPKKAMGAPPEPCDACRGGAKKLKVKLVRDPELPEQGGNVTWLEDDGSGNARATVLFGQAPTMTAYAVDKAGAMQVATVKWEIVAESAPGAGPKSLYPDKPETFFAGDPAHPPESVQFQTVHIGTFKVKATAQGGEQVDPLTIEILVLRPFGLGAVHNRYDREILDAANSFGIPPQVVKSHVRQEARITNGEFDPSSYRYEPRTKDWAELWVKHRNDSYFWRNRQWDFTSYRLPWQPGSLLLNEDIARRNEYHQITSFTGVDPPAWPYGPCRNWDLLDSPVLLWDTVEADDGWAWCSYPWQQYNYVSRGGQCSQMESHKGPCDVRYGWVSSAENNLMSYLRCTKRFYCGVFASLDYECTGEQRSLSDWLLNGEGRTYVGQTAIAASYGLMQITYTTAVQTMKWEEGHANGGARHPSFLFDPHINLSVGVGYDALLIMDIGFEGQASRQFVTLDAYRQALKDGVAFYRTGEGTNDPDYTYAKLVVDGAANFKPY